MLPEEIYASSAPSAKFKYSHPLNHMLVDDGSMRARLAYDLMTFMHRSDCNYFINPETSNGYDPSNSDDEVDILIVDGFYKEAEMLIDHHLEKDPDNEKALFQKAFIKHLRHEYKKLLEHEDKILESDPENINALLNKGFALANLNREEEALGIIDKALHIDPDNLNVLANKAYIAKLLGRDDLREQTLKAAYNASAKKHLELLEEQEAHLLEDLGSVFMSEKFTEIDTPSAFEAFNKRSGIAQSNAVH